MARYIVEKVKGNDLMGVEFLSYAGALDYYMETIKVAYGSVKVRLIKVRDSGEMKVVATFDCEVA